VCEGSNVAGRAGEGTARCAAYFVVVVRPASVVQVVLVVMTVRPAASVVKVVFVVQVVLGAACATIGARMKAAVAMNVAMVFMFSGSCLCERRCGAGLKGKTSAPSEDECERRDQCGEDQARPGHCQVTQGSPFGGRGGQQTQPG
jgi:hypothetical protein